MDLDKGSVMPQLVLLTRLEPLCQSLLWLKTMYKCVTVLARPTDTPHDWRGASQVSFQCGGAANKFALDSGLRRLAFSVQSHIPADSDQFIAGGGAAGSSRCAKGTAP